MFAPKILMHEIKVSCKVLNFCILYLYEMWVKCHRYRFLFSFKMSHKRRITKIQMDINKKNNSFM